MSEANLSESGGNGNGNGSDKATDKAAPEILQMQDGRLVEFAGKRKLLKEVVAYGDDGGPVQVRFDLRNGQTRLFTVPAAMLGQFAGHGAMQKIGDTTAGLDDVDDMTLAIDEAIDRHYNGQWNAVRESDGMAGTSVLLRAMIESYPNRTAEQLKTFLAGKTGKEKRVMRTSERLSPIIKRLEEEKAKKGDKVDEASLFAGLEDDGAAGAGAGAQPGFNGSTDDAAGLAHATAPADPYTDADAGKALAGGGGKKKGGAAKTTEVSPG